MTDNPNNNADRKIDSALNAMFERRESETDGARLAQRVISRAGELRRRRRHPVLVRALQLAGPLAAAAAILAVLLFTQEPGDAEAAYRLAEEMLSTSPPLAYTMTTASTFRDRTHELSGKVYISEGGKFCHVIESPRGRTVVGSDGEHFWFRMGEVPLVLFDNYDELQEAARTNPMIHGLLHRVLRLDRMLADLREDTEPVLLEQRPEGPRIGMRSRRRNNQAPLVENVVLQIDQENRRVDRLTITLTAGDRIARTMELVYSDETVDKAVFDYTSYVGEQGTIKPDAFEKRVRQWREKHMRSRAPRRRPRGGGGRTRVEDDDDTM